jgi:hypothetical protein
MTMIAYTLYNMLAKRLRGFQDCDAPKIYRHFIKGKEKITLTPIFTQVLTVISI